MRRPRAALCEGQLEKLLGAVSFYRGTVMRKGAFRALMPMWRSPRW